MQSSSKKIALVTGANKGIGFEIARQIGHSGVTVLLGARKEAAGEEAAAMLAAEGIAAHFIAIDVADYGSTETAATAIASNFGRLDILVNNAGINDPSDGAVPTAQLDAVERVLRTNFLGALAVTQAVLRCCERRRPPASSMCQADSDLSPRTATPLIRMQPPSSSATAPPKPRST